MNDFVLSCCSTADLSREHFERRNISYTCFRYSLNGVEYPDDLGQTVSFSDFYKAMREGAETKTSQININEYLSYFSGFLEKGLDVLHLCVSSGITGSYNAAASAALIARERYPERKIYVLDSLTISSGFGLLMDALADKRDEGMDIEQLRDWAEENKLKVHHWFFSTDLSFYVKGGRISKTAGVFGGVLNICPLMNVNAQGRLIPRAKIRTKKRVMQEMVERMAECADDGENYSGKVYMCHSDCYDDARTVADMVEARFPNINGRVEINDIGTTIGCHSGPGTVAVFFFGKERED